MTEQTEDPIQFIERAAGRHAKGLLSGGADPEVEIFVGDVSVYKVRRLGCFTRDRFPTSLSQQVRIWKHTTKP